MYAPGNFTAAFRRVILDPVTWRFAHLVLSVRCAAEFQEWRYSRHAELCPILFRRRIKSLRKASVGSSVTVLTIKRAEKVYQ